MASITIRSLERHDLDGLTEVLDTVTGTDAYRLYTRHGWQRCGEIPNYAHWPDGRPCPTTIFFKALSK